jgi:4-hydroxy-tetrahydrodipicolinate reductase
MPYRVIQWSTGNVGRYALRGIINHPDMELAGVWVSGDAKAGMDAGELCGLPPVGVAATTDADALLALDADAVCYNATADVRLQEALGDLVRILESGKNVVSSSVVFLVEPKGAELGFVEPLQKACAAGGVSCFTSGIDPGFANDVLPLLLTGICERIDSVRVQEVLNYATYDQPTVLFDTMGFARPLDHTPLLLQPGILGLAWGGTIRAIADGLGVKVDSLEEWHERVPATETFDVPSGTVEQGTTAGLRFEVRAMIAGEPRIVLEHVTRLREDVAPEWPAPPGVGGYRVLIEGSPDVTCELTTAGDGGDENSGGLIVTAMRLVNAIPAVVAAPPGLLGPLDVGIPTGRGLLSGGQ